MPDLFIGVDVGTGSARAGVFDETGTLLGTARQAIRLWREDGGIAEQSSRDIWAAVGACVRGAMRAADASAEDVKGIGFDATCSLVVVGPHGAGLPIGASGDPERDIIVWMDHRAVDQTRRINAGGHAVLAYVGGALSPEMQTPKLLWLKERRRHVFDAAEHFFDLADYLSFRATGSEARSLCTLTCKWTYLAHENRWDADYFRAIGLEELADEGFRRIGTQVAPIGAPLGAGLTPEAARDFGLRPGTPVGASAIDAHAGGIGTLGASAEGSAPDPAAQMALIMGTSSCAMAVTHEPAFVDGVWGPYRDALLPGHWLLEGGQSAHGAALDHLVSMHPAFPAARDAAQARGIALLDHLERRACEIAGSPDDAARLAATLHVVPEFLGNRSPEADPAARGAISGLGLDTGEASLVSLFVAGLCGLSYGTARIVEAMRAEGAGLGTIVVSGGAARSTLMRRILADATGLNVALPRTSEPVLLGSAIIGAVAAGRFSDVSAAAAAMGGIGEATAPNPALAPFHAAKRRAHDILRKAERAVRAAQPEAFQRT
jgi:D-ribulokinase